VQAELSLHPSQQIGAGLVKADPDDVARMLGPLARFLDGNIFDPASTAVHARGNDPGFGPPMSRDGLVSSGVHGFSKSLFVCYGIIYHSCRSVDSFTLWPRPLAAITHGETKSSRC
jgi:hypothetical protein